MPPIELDSFSEPKLEDQLTEDQSLLYDSIRRWRKDAATRRKTDASLILNKSVMLKLSKLRLRPRTLDQLGDSGLFEPWRITCYGEEILRVFEAWRESRRGRPKSS